MKPMVLTEDGVVDLVIIKTGAIVVSDDKYYSVDMYHAKDDHTKIVFHGWSIPGYVDHSSPEDVMQHAEYVQMGQDTVETWNAVMLERSLEGDEHKPDEPLLLPWETEPGVIYPPKKLVFYAPFGLG